MALHEQISIISLATVLLFTSSCSSDLTAPPTSAPPPASRSYHGTASVGDFMNITLNSVSSRLKKPASTAPPRR